MNVAWLMRMKRWVQHPPSAGRVKFVFAVVQNTLVTGPSGPRPNGSKTRSNLSKWM